MAATTSQVRILLIRPWIRPLAPIRAALRDAALDARILRVDLEPALNAALARGGFDIIVFDPLTKELPRPVVQARLTPDLEPVVLANDGLAAQIAAALISRLN
jgi:hypothetical protein